MSIDASSAWPDDDEFTLCRVLVWLLPVNGTHVRAEDAPAEILSAAVTRILSDQTEVYEEPLATFVRKDYETKRVWWRDLPAGHPARDVARRALLDAGFTEDQFADWLGLTADAEIT